MKIMIILGMMICSCVTYACDEDPQSGGASVQGDTRTGSQVNQLSGNSGSGQIQCIELPPIKAVIGYLFVPQNWLGGAIGISYALSMPSGGGGSYHYVSNNLNTISGCEDTSPEAAADRYYDAKLSFEIQRNRWTNMANNPNSTVAEREYGEEKIDIYSQPGAVWEQEWPDLSRSMFEILNFNQAILSEVLCIPDDSW